MDLWERLAELDATALIVFGLVLVVIPEPATSAAGLGIVLLGVAWWISNWQ
ncbi:MAG: hypothetical protein ABEI75_02310 [Halobaculum sp.]